MRPLRSEDQAPSAVLIDPAGALARRSGQGNDAAGPEPWLPDLDGDYVRRSDRDLVHDRTLLGLRERGRCQDRHDEGIDRAKHNHLSGSRWRVGPYSRLILKSTGARRVLEIELLSSLLPDPARRSPLPLRNIRVQDERGEADRLRQEPRPTSSRAQAVDCIAGPIHLATVEDRETKYQCGRPRMRPSRASASARPCDRARHDETGARSEGITIR